MIVFFSGLPKAGKSVTLAEIYKRLRTLGESFFLERICPDCEGIWTGEAPAGQDIARKEKNQLKAAGQFFSPAFITMKCRAIASLAKSFRLVLLDMGGIPSKENELFIQTAIDTGVSVRAVLMKPVGSDAADWEDFWARFHIVPLEVETGFGKGDDYLKLAETAADAAIKVLE